jgi:hypothetical protein
MVNESVFAGCPHRRKLEQAISVAGARDYAREGSLAGGARGGLAGLGFLTLEKRGTGRDFPEKSAPVNKTAPFLTFQPELYSCLFG